MPLEVRSSKSVKEMEAQLDLTRKQLEEERAEADAKMEAEQVDFEAEQKRKMSAELHEFETELAQEREKEELIEKSKLEELEKRKEELAAERKNRMKQEMEAMEQLQQQEQSQILEESKQNIERMEDVMNSEKMRNKAALKAKLAERKKKKNKAAGGGDKTPEPAVEPAKPAESASVPDADAEAEQTSEPVAAAPTPEPEAEAEAAEAEADPEPEPEILNIEDEDSDLDIQDDEDSTDLYARLCAIEKRLVGASSSSSAAAAAASNSGGGSGASSPVDNDGPAYIDDADAKWKLKGTEPKLVRPSEITSSRFVSFRFGEFIMDLLAKKLGFPKPALLLASSLPKATDELGNDYHHNMYRNSFFYEPKSNSLYIRIDRLNSVGGLTVMLVHTLSHIALDDMADDRKHAFMKKYHKALEVCCADMFASKALMTDGVDVEKFLATTLNEHSFNENRQVQQRSALVSALLALGTIDESEVGIVEVTVAEHDLAAQQKHLDEVTAEVEDSGGEPDDPRMLAAQNRVNFSEINLEVAKRHSRSMKDAEQKLAALRTKQNSETPGDDDDAEAGEAAAAMAAMQADMAQKKELKDTVDLNGVDGDGRLTKEKLKKANSKANN